MDMFTSYGVLLAQFSLYVHKGGLKPDSFHFIHIIWSYQEAKIKSPIFFMILAWASPFKLILQNLESAPIIVCGRLDLINRMISNKHHLANTKHFYNTCTTHAQRLRRWSSIEQMLYKCFAFTGQLRNVLPCTPAGVIQTKKS